MTVNKAFADHFSSLAAQYAAFRPGYPDALFRWLASIAPERKLGWDCACGSGQASQGVARYFDHVIATDASAEQIKSARPNPKIEYRVALAEQSGLADYSVDLLTAAQAAHWFQHDAFYAEARRVLKPRGIIALWTYELFTIHDSPVEDCLKSFYHHIIEPYWPPERRFVKEHYQTLPFPFADEITPPPFEEVMNWNLHQLMGYCRSWSAVKKYAEANGIDPVEKVENDLRTLWGDADKPKAITMPIYMRVAQVD
jgi:ubiquinone/menaquinone biosynthesis C-methylase UbiE